MHARLMGIPVEEKLVNIAKQEQRGKDYKSMNPLAKLPCLQVSRSLLSVACTTTCHPNKKKHQADDQEAAAASVFSTFVCCRMVALCCQKALQYSAT